MRLTGSAVLGCLVLATSAASAAAAELKPQTVRAFERYVQLTEERMRAEIDGRTGFLWLDRLSAAERDEVLARLGSGEAVIERLETRDGGDEVDIPSGMVHHWLVGPELDRSTAAKTVIIHPHRRRRAVTACRGGGGGTRRGSWSAR